MLKACLEVDRHFDWRRRRCECGGGGGARGGARRSAGGGCRAEWCGGGEFSSLKPGRDCLRCAARVAVGGGDASIAKIAPPTANEWYWRRRRRRYHIHSECRVLQESL
jgi:hypothetical protein